MSAVSLTALRTEVAPLWVEDLAGRGTWSLLYSCTFILGICVWTSIHLNVPPQEPSWKSWRRKLKWLFAALFAPEIVVFTAFQQWLTAKLFLKELIKISDAKACKDLEGGEGSQLKRQFDMTYAFYATMGGFAVDIEYLHNIVKQGTLTTNGLLFLADQGHFFEVSPESISDKSKASLLAKVLVCLQVLWAAGQTIERKVARYPISLLEFHTLVHVFCALVMYTLWLRKPYDIGNPTVVSVDVDESALAFIVASSRWTGRSGFVGKGSGAVFWVDPLISLFNRRIGYGKDPKFVYYGVLEQSPRIMQRNNEYGIFRLDNIDDPRVKNHIVLADVFHSQPTIDPKKIYYGNWNTICYYNVPDGIRQTLCLSGGQALCSGLGPFAFAGNSNPWSIGDRVQLSDKDLIRLDLAGVFISNGLWSNNESRDLSRPPLSEKAIPVDQPFDTFEAHTLNRHGRRLIRHREENILFNSGLLLQSAGSSEQGWEAVLLVLAVALIPAAYGGIHLSALNEMFPTSIESILWKASCFTLVGFAAVLLLIIFGLYLLGEAEDWNWSIHRDRPKSAWTAGARRLAKRVGNIMKWSSAVGVYCLLVIIAFIYIGARAFLVLESFISLRHVPVGVYKTPPTNFMGYIPHL